MPLIRIFLTASEVESAFVCLMAIWNMSSALAYLCAWLIFLLTLFLILFFLISPSSSLSFFLSFSYQYADVFL